MFINSTQYRTWFYTTQHGYTQFTTWFYTDIKYTANKMVLCTHIVHSLYNKVLYRHMQCTVQNTGLIQNTVHNMIIYSTQFTTCFYTDIKYTVHKMGLNTRIVHSLYNKVLYRHIQCTVQNTGLIQNTVHNMVIYSTQFTTWFYTDI